MQLEARPLEPLDQRVPAPECVALDLGLADRVAKDSEPAVRLPEGQERARDRMAGCGKELAARCVRGRRTTQSREHCADTDGDQGHHSDDTTYSHEVLSFYTSY